MRKEHKLTILLAFILILVVCMAACTTGGGSDYTLKLVDEVDYFEFTAGQIDWSKIVFNVLDKDGYLVSVVTATESMVSSEDLAKLTTSGIKTITITYQGSKLELDFHLIPADAVTEFTVVFNAGLGTFNEDGSVTEGSNIKTFVGSTLDAIPVPTRAGYDFVGWFEDENATGDILVTPYALKRNMNLYAKWSDQRKFTVSYYLFHDDVSLGLVSSVNRIEYGTKVSFISAEQKQGFTFEGYEVWNSDEVYDSETSTFIPANQQDAFNWVVTSNVSVKLQYSTHMITISYVSSAWKEGDVVDGVTIIDGGTVNGEKLGKYTTQVPYGTNLVANQSPVPVLPEKDGHSGLWIDDVTGKEPIYGVLTTEINVTARYTINQYSMYFYDENLNLLENLTRTVDYNSYIATEPNVPTKPGHIGMWMVYNDGFDDSVLDGQLIQISLRQLAMTKDINVYAIYNPERYPINFYYKMQGMDEFHKESFTYSYGTTIDRAIDMTSDKVIDGISYKGYDPKYYDFEWYTNDAYLKQVVFPDDVVAEAQYYCKVVVKPYQVEFRLPSNIQNSTIRPEIKTVPVGERVVPPSWILDSHTIMGWYYTAETPDYDANKSYKVGDYVYYYEQSYKCISAATAGVLPTNTLYWKQEVNTVRFFNSSGASDGIEVNDFHLYDEIERNDRAFYAILQIKKFNVSFYNMTFNADNEKAFTQVASSQFDYGTTDVQSAVASVVLNKPEYTNGVVSSFEFENWYLDEEFKTLAVELDNLAPITGDVKIYAKWVDAMVGTEGLIYEAYNDGLAVVGFEPDIAEYSVIKLRIPETYDGKNVLAIGSEVFNNFAKVIFIESMVLPSTLVDIAENAFAGCYALKSIENNSNSFVVENGVLYNADKSVIILAIPQYENGLDAFTVPASVKKIGIGAFNNVASLTEISFEANSQLTEIGDYAFDGCTNLSKIALTESLVRIGDYAFRGCVSLGTQSISIPVSNNLKKVGFGCFDDCLSALNEIGDYLAIGGVLVKYVGTETNLVLDNSIVAIADGAFAYSQSDAASSNFEITSIEVGPDSKLVYIGSKAFANCSALARIDLKTASMVEVENDTFVNVSYSCKLYVNASLVSIYEANEYYLNSFGAENIIGE